MTEKIAAQVSETGALATALVQAQAAMPRVEPDATNPHFKTKFVSLDHLIAKTRPVLNQHGLSISQFPACSDLGAPVLRTVLSHASGEQMAADMPLYLNKQDMQALGAAITYARRYAWASVLGISADEDDDGNTASAPAKAGASKPDEGRQGAPGAAGQPSKPPAGGPGPNDEVTAGLVGRLVELAGLFGGAELVANTNVSIAKNRAATEGDLRAHREWLGRQVRRLEENIGERKAAAESQFQPPASVKDAA